MNGHEDSRNKEGHAEQPENHEKPKMRVMRSRLFITALNATANQSTKNKEKQSSSYAELPSNFNRNSSNRQVFHNDETEQPPGLGNEPSVRRIEYETCSLLPHRDSQTSGTKPNSQYRNNQVFKKSDSTGSRPQYLNKFREPFHQNFKKDPSKRYSGSQNIESPRRTGSQENLDLNGNRDRICPANKPVGGYRGKTRFPSNYNGSRDFKDFASGHRHPLSRSQDSLVEFNNSDRRDEKDSWQNQNCKEVRDSVSTNKRNFQPNYDRNYQGTNRSESKSKGYGRTYESHGKQNQFRSAKPRAELEKEHNFSKPYNHLDRKSDKSHWNGNTVNKNHDVGSTYDRNYLKNGRDTDHGRPHHNSDKKRDTFDKNYHMKSGNWDSDDCVSSISDEPQVSETIKTQPEILEKVTDTVNVGSENSESLKSPPITFPGDTKTGSSQKDFFQIDDCEGSIPIPPPHPALPEDDALSVSSENLHSYGSTYTASNEGETSSYEDSSSFDESDYVLEPEQIKAVTDYLKKKETERSVPVEIANRIVSDVNRVLRYWAKDNEVVLYGSYLSGLAISTSNLNLALNSNQRSKNSFLLSFQKQLSKDLVGYEVVPFEEEIAVRNSKICFYEPNSGITCEIMYSGKTVSDHTRTSHLIKKVCAYDPRIKTLIIAARIWAEVCLIHETENGQLHPSGFVLLVVHFLQQIEPPVLPIIDESSSKHLDLKPLPAKNFLEIGQLWFEFLKYYSHTFSWTKNVVTVHCKDEVLKSTLKWNSWIAIQDPYSMKNVAESVVTLDNAQYIFSCFKAYYEYFSTSSKDSVSDSDESRNKNSDKEWKYSFDSSSVNCPLPVFCETCDELEDELCEKCRLNQRTFTATFEPLPEVDDISMKFIDKALLDVYNDIILPDTYINGRNAFVQDLESYVRKIFRDAELTLFGSSVNKFGIKHSDLDICMTFSNKTKEDIQEVKILKRITSHLRKRKMYDGVFGLYSAQVPIVKFHCPTQKWNCDLSLYNVLPVHNSKLLSKYAMIDERCRILGCALKHLAMKGWIADSASKTLSSYSYILMVIHYLQQTQPPVLPVLPLEDQKVFVEKKEIPREVITGKNYWFHEDADALKKRYATHHRNESSMAELWIGFLDYYLNFKNDYAVTITQKEPKLSSELQKCARLINIEDPFIYNRNLGCVLSEEKAERTYKIFARARSLFRHNVPKEKIDNPRNHYFSTNNLTGTYGKEMECTSCGAFDHETEKCLKANPFMKFNFKSRIPNIRYPRKRK